MQFRVKHVEARMLPRLDEATGRAFFGAWYGREHHTGEPLAHSEDGDRVNDDGELVTTDRAEIANYLRRAKARGDIALAEVGR